MDRPYSNVFTPNIFAPSAQLFILYSNSIIQSTPSPVPQNDTGLFGGNCSFIQRLFYTMHGCLLPIFWGLRRNFLDYIQILLLSQLLPLYFKMILVCFVGIDHSSNDCFTPCMDVCPIVHSDHKWIYII